MHVRALLLLTAFCFTPLFAANPDITIADFEGDSYGAWTVTGKAFGDRPARGTLPGQMAVSGFRGKGLVNSFVGGDGTTGKLTSPKFTVERDYLNFLIGGGGYTDRTCMNLLLDGKVVRTATGPNVEAGGSEELKPTHWDVREFRGKAVVLQIVDDHTGGWGHINVDHIVQSNTKQGEEIKVVRRVDRIREIRLTEKYLIFPITNSARPCRMTIVVDGKTIHDFDINLSADKPDWWARLDVPEFTGKSAKITAYRVPEESKGIDLVESSATIRHARPVYAEPLRPQLRFSQMQGWNNDPNGMVYHDGEYHLFWQSNPFGPQWGNMYWGHAVSKDLVHWEELPYALYPRVMAKNHCFSGSAHVDVDNTGGWGKNAMIAAFTDTGAGETLAVSTDKGRTWKYIAENPVIGKRKLEGRDPKLIWYEPGRHWVIAVYTRVEPKAGAKSASWIDAHVDPRNRVEFYRSTDLKKWEKTGDLPGYFECPEMFELPVDGDGARKKWVISAADGKYAVGAFDGKTFTPDHVGKHQVHDGAIYAAQCFSRTPGGRVIQVGWARMEMPNMPFNQAFTLPIELTLRTTANGVRLFAEPIKELEVLRGKATAVRGAAGEKPVAAEVTGQLLEISTEIEPRDAKEVRLTFGSNTLTYDVSAGKLDGMPLPMVDKRIRLRLIVDRPMYELIGNGGAIYKTAARKDGGKEFPTVSVSATGGTANVSMTLHPLKSIWNR